jgi:carboxypeptidase Taq
MIHEAGHALYEQGLDAANYGLPVCDSASLGMHESQSRLWENQIGRSREFWKHWYPQLKNFFPGQLDHLSLDDFVLAINRVSPSLIRVEADEVTYGLHIILRYEIEKELISEEISVTDLPAVWDSKMEEYLGIRPANEGEGVLQDTHWSQGLIGYFPTYLLGNLYGAQILATAAQEIPDLKSQVSSGRMLELREWLRVNVHIPGNTLSATDLISRITGEDLSADYFLDYLDEKYSELYQL